VLQRTTHSEDEPEIWMLHWTCGRTRRDQIRNDDIQDKLEVTQIQKKLVQHHL
jgi:hypothetical protein